MTDHPTIVNPSAIGNPDETPVMRVPAGPAGDVLRMLVDNNRRAWLAERCATCGSRRETHSAPAGQEFHDFVDKSIAENQADRLADMEAARRPTRDGLLHLVEAVVTAAGQHRSAAIRVAHARRTLTTSELEAALAASDSAHEAERDAVRALRAAITRAVAA